MKLSWLTLVSFLLTMITASAIRTRRQGCFCGDYKSDFDICDCDPECECGCRSSANSVVFKAAKLKKPSNVGSPPKINRERPYQSDYICPHCSGFLESSGLPRTHFRTWKHPDNRFRRLINKFRPLYSYYPGSLLSQRKFSNIFKSPGYVLPYLSKRPLYPTIDETAGSGNWNPALNSYYGNTGSFNSGFETSSSQSITSDQSSTEGCDCGNMHFSHNEPNSFAFANDEIPNNENDNCHCKKKALSECEIFLNSEELEKSPQRENTFEEKLAFGPSKIPVDITKKVLKIPNDNLQSVKSCSCKGENKKQVEIEKILRDKKSELKLRNKIRKNEPLRSTNRSEYPLMSFRPTYGCSGPILQQNSRNVFNPYDHYENDWDEENEEYAGDFRTQVGIGHCRCGSEDCFPRNKILDRLTSNYENARILHLEYSECYS